MDRLLVIGHVWPEPKTTAAGMRMLQLLQVFAQQHYHITFASTAVKTPHSMDLTKIGVKEQPILLNDSRFDGWVKEWDPDIVIFDRFMVEEQFGWRVAKACPNTIRVLNTEDLHSLREYREQCVKKGRGFSSEKWLCEDKTKREMASIYRSDLSLMVSTHEMELLEKELQLPKYLLMHLPFMLDEIDEATTKKWPSFEERRDFITFGNGKHAPNVDSIIHMKKEIWPLVRKQLPKANLHVYGAYLPSSITQLHDEKDGFFVHGWIDNLEAKIKKARVVLAPLRFGAGIKGKLSLAMQCGTPNVTTTLGAEGMASALDWAGKIADGPKDFAQRAVELHTDQSEWSSAQQNGIQLINTLYSKNNLERLFFERLKKLEHGLTTHRSKNFTGAMLQHQTMAATKYMGKWIEEKNKHQQQSGPQQPDGFSP